MVAQATQQEQTGCGSCESYLPWHVQVYIFNMAVASVLCWTLYLPGGVHHPCLPMSTFSDIFLLCREEPGLGSFCGCPKSHSL